MSDQNWRTETNATDYLGHQKKKLGLADRRPVIRKPSDLVGPGIAANAIRLDDFNDHLATYDGFFSADVGALNGPSGEALIGFITSDETLGGVQIFAGLTSGTTYQRVFVRNPSDEATIYWGDWEVLGSGTGGGVFIETLPVSIIDAKGDLIVGVSNNVAMRLAVGDDGTVPVADSSAAGGVAWGSRVVSIVPGANIDVDDADPENPIISTAGFLETQWLNTDSLVVAVAGAQTMYLSHVPIPTTLQIWWGGVPQPPTEWTVDANVVTIPDPTGLVKYGHKFTAYYEYDVNEETPISDFTIPFGSSGWYYLSLPGSPDDNTDDHTTDDITAWTLASTSPIGENGPQTVHTELMWVARDVPPCTAMTLRIRIEDNGPVYVNGTLVYTFAEHGSGSWPETAIVVDPDLLYVDAPNRVMVRVNDETPIVLAGVSIDIQVEGTG